MTFKAIIIIVCLLFANVISQDSGEEALGNSTKIDDQQKISGPVGDVITGLEMYENANKIRKGAEAVPEVIDKVKNASIKNVVKDVKSLGKGLVFNYKEGMQGIIKFTRESTKKLSDILSFAEKRVNMWRTTLPMIESYGENMKALADNGSEHIKSFRLKDLIDLDRKWDKEMNNQLVHGMQFNYAVYSYLYGKARSEDRVYDGIVTLLMNEQVSNELMRDDKNIQALVNVTARETDDWYKIPEVVIVKTGNMQRVVEDITSEANKPSSKDKTVTEEQLNYDYIAEKLQNTNATITDQKELQSMIRKELYKSNEQCNDLEGLQNNIDALYTRLLMRKMEKLNVEKGNTQAQLDVLISGKPLTAVN